MGDGWNKNFRRKKQSPIFYSWRHYGDAEGLSHINCPMALMGVRRGIVRSATANG
jgi:hypothetical protein